MIEDEYLESECIWIFHIDALGNQAKYLFFLRLVQYMCQLTSQPQDASLTETSEKLFDFLLAMTQWEEDDLHTTHQTFLPWIRVNLTSWNQSSSPIDQVHLYSLYDSQLTLSKTSLLSRGLISTYSLTPHNHLHANFQTEPTIYTIKAAYGLSKTSTLPRMLVKTYSNLV